MVLSEQDRLVHISNFKFLNLNHLFADCGFGRAGQTGPHCAGFRCKTFVDKYLQMVKVMKKRGKQYRVTP